MTYLAVAVLAAAIAYRIGARRRPAPRRCPESYWHGYRRGYDDGVITTVHHERTPSLN